MTAAAASAPLALGRVALHGGVPDGIALVLKSLVGAHQTVLHLCRDDGQIDTIRYGLATFAPALDLLVFPAWGCLPYDRVSPTPEVVSRRHCLLARAHLTLAP